MNIIKLTKGYEAIVDEDNYNELSKYKWYYHNSGYAIRSIRKNDKKFTIYMHREILKNEKFIDHINGNGLDNRKENLRECSHKENIRNRNKQKNNTSGFKGVFWDKNKNVYKAQIKVNQKNIYLGSFTDKEEAAKIYDKAAIKYFGEFARLNFSNEHKKASQ